MGLFSWKCAVSGESVASVYSEMPKEQSEVYLITPGETFYEPAYEGYGDFGGVDVYTLLGDGDRDKGIDEYFDKDKKPIFEIKVVLRKHFDGQEYEDLPTSESCEHQGYFYDT